MSQKNLESIDHLEVEPLSDEALETVAGGKGSDGPMCCSCSHCSRHEGDPRDVVPDGEGG